jgi:pimeloyl-ACP methyl ester carboxylesterase
MTALVRRELRFLDGSIAAVDNGVSPDAATVLLVPGYTGSKEDFQPLLRPLAEAGLRAVAIDQRGQYQSSWARTAADYQLPALAEDVHAIAAELHKSTQTVHLLGHSFGGLVAGQAVIADPVAFNDLVLMDSGPGAVDGNRRAQLDSGEPVLAAGGMPALWQHLQARSQADPRYVRPAPALLEFLRTRFLATDPVGLRVMGEVLRSEPDRVAELAARNVAALVLYGENDDAWTPAQQSDMAARLRAREAIIPAAAHSPAVENPRATAAALIKFWQR